MKTFISKLVQNFIINICVKEITGHCVVHIVIAGRNSDFIRRNNRNKLMHGIAVNIAQRIPCFNKGDFLACGVFIRIFCKINNVYIGVPAEKYVRPGDAK